MDTRPIPTGVWPRDLHDPMWPYAFACNYFSSVTITHSLGRVLVVHVWAGKWVFGRVVQSSRAPGHSAKFRGKNREFPCIILVTTHERA
jgi:hypothetical protein